MSTTKNMSMLAGMMTCGLFLTFSCQKKEEKTETVTEDTTIEKEAEVVSEDMCFLKVVSKDSMKLTASFKGDSVTGVYKWLPAEKDRKILNFKGLKSGTTINAVGIAEAEGMTAKEELIIEFLEGGQVKVLMGEMTEGKDGVWHYKDRNAAQGQVLDKTDCI